MTNCLKTQLKASVQNENLPYFESLEFQVGVSHTCYFRPVNGKTITVYGPNGAIQTLSEGGYVQFEPNVKYRVSSYIDLDGISFFYANMPATPTCLVYCENVTTFYYGGNLDGKLLPNTSAITDMEFGECSVINGNYLTAWLKRQSVLPKMTYPISGYTISTTDLAELVTNSNDNQYSISRIINGRIEDYVIQRKNYFGTGSAVFEYLKLGTNMSFDGNAIVGTGAGITVNVSWVPNSTNPSYTDVTCNGSTITIDENGDKVS